MSGIGDIPTAIPGISYSDVAHGATELYDFGKAALGFGGLTAGRLHHEMEGVDWDGIDHIRDLLISANEYLESPFQADLQNILDGVNAAYGGAASDDITRTFKQAMTDAQHLSEKYYTVLNRFGDVQDALVACKNAVAGYSRAGSDVSNVTSMVPGGGDSQDDKAQDAWNKCKDNLRDNGGAIAQVQSSLAPTNLYSVPPTVIPPQPPPGYQNPGGATPTAGGVGGTTGTGGVGGVGGAHPGRPPYEFHPISGPVMYHPPLDPPGHGGDPVSGPVGDPGGLGTYHPGGAGGVGAGPVPGVDSGSSLAGVDGGGLGGGAGLGGTGDPGSGAGVAGAGGTGSTGPGAGATGSGAAAPGTAGGGLRGFGGVPLGGAGHGGNDGERERSTWLVEDDDVWGGSDALSGVIGA